MNWKETREQLVSNLKLAQMELRPPKVRTHDVAELRNIRNGFLLSLDEYVENVPWIPVSRCPICGQALEMVIDLEGLDSPWWWDTCPRAFPGPKACEHYQVFLGALDLKGRQPTEVDIWAVQPGPGVPYVIERMLAVDGMQAVVSSVKVGANDTAYIIIYFASNPVQPYDLHQLWRRESWVVYDKDGDPVGQDVSKDPWCFELLPWLENGKLGWIRPGDELLELNYGLPCPYDGLDGIRDKQVISRGELRLQAAPSESAPEYYAPFE